mmetsp:Transcript_22812/g.28253  ORF Transcript_22812/g.28253 Transcript_22812/m.28253 type:complete len:84 (-) Transcript_22812:1121-1372(-)
MNNCMIITGMQHLQTGPSSRRNFNLGQASSAEPSYKNSGQTEEVRTPPLAATDSMENSGILSWTKDANLEDPCNKYHRIKISP